MKPIIIIILCLITAAPLRSQDDSTAFKLNEYFSALTRQEKFNGNVLINWRGEVLLNNSYNIASLPESLKVNSKTKFIIASVSKLFIKFSILKLAEENMLSLDDRISRFIPDFPSGEKITVLQLMMHKSGLPRELTDYEKYDNLTLQKTIELAKEEKLLFEPGTQTLYSNVGFFLLHFIISGAAKEGYPRFTRQNVLTPLGMLNTSEYHSLASIPGFAYGFGKEEGKIIPVEEKNIDRFETGNYFSTIEDMYKFSEGILSGRILTRETGMEMFNDSTVMQAGGRPGYRAYFYMNLKDSLTFILLSNFSGIPFEDIVKTVPDIVAGKPYEMLAEVNRKEITLANETLERYTGKFSLEADATQVFAVTAENNRLVMTDNDGEKTILLPDSETTFFFDPASEEGIEFIYNKQTGKYEMVIYSGGITLKAKRIEE